VRPRYEVRTAHISCLADNLIRHMGLCLPPINFPLLAARYCREAELPAAALPVALRLHGLSPSAGLSLEQASVAAPPHAHVMACLLVAEKVLFFLRLRMLTSCMAYLVVAERYSAALLTRRDGAFRCLSIVT